MAKAQAQEPSMEEILASIRRIIADEEATPKGAKAPEPEPELESEPDEVISEDDLDKLFASAGKDEPEMVEPEIVEEVEEEEDDVLDLTDELMAEDPPLVEGIGEDTDLAFEDPGDDLMEDLVEPEPEPEPEPAPPPPPVMAAPPPPPRPRPAPMPAPEPMIEEEHLISQATEGFVSSAFGDLALTVLNRNARTLEDLVQDMLRPMLKGWLDQNLPAMVERMVRAEIERVSRGR